MSDSIILEACKKISRNQSVINNHLGCGFIIVILMLSVILAIVACPADAQERPLELNLTNAHLINPDCSLTVIGISYVYLNAVYEHEHPDAPDRRWESMSQITVEVDWTTRFNGIGTPVGYEWYQWYPSGPARLIGTCGDVGRVWLLFADGFETGDLSRWEVAGL